MLRRRLKKLLSLPPRESLRLVRHELLARSQPYVKRWKHARTPSYRQELSSKDFFPIFSPGTKYSEIDEDLQYYLERVRAHDFDLLGSGWVSWNREKKLQVNPKNRAHSAKLLRLLPAHYRPIDWQLDPKSAATWSATTWYRDIQYGKQFGVDVKLPWEIGRLQHLLPLSLESRNDKEVEHQLLDFIASNPPGYGVQWACTMDVAIRAANIAISSSIKWKTFSLDCKIAVTNSLLDHLHFISENLEWSPHLRSNHYLANICGLLVASASIENSSFANKCLIFSIAELEKEVKEQFQNDGSNFEASTAYHRLCFEMITTALIVLCNLSKSRRSKLENWNGQKIQMGLVRSSFSSISESIETIAQRFKKAEQFLRFVKLPTGEHLNVGDNDSGRFIITKPKLIQKRMWQANIDESLELAEILSVRENSRHPLSGHLNALESSEPMTPIEQAPDFGLFSLRISGATLWLRAGHLGQKGNGGHAHNDQLSILLSLRSTPILVDPGTGVYTPDPETRNLYRSSAFHNSLQLEEEEQNEIITEREELFRLKERTQATVESMDSDEILARHFGFKSEHRREVQLTDSGFEILDRCESPKLKRLYFHFYPGLEIRNDETSWLVLHQGKSLIRLSFGSASSVREDYLYSRDYGRFETADRLIFSFSEKTHTTTIEVLH